MKLYKKKRVARVLSRLLPGSWVRVLTLGDKVIIRVNKRQSAEKILQGWKPIVTYCKGGPI